VYTSGKGSSAAGLTAAVVQDANSREFFLEVKSLKISCTLAAKARKYSRQILVAAATPAFAPAIRACTLLCSRSSITGSSF
jgi:hypothetical protein